MIYPAIFLALILLRWLSSSAQDIRQMLYWVVLLSLFLFSAFRLEVGCDWWGYYKHFERQFDLTLEDALQHRDPLWWLLVRVIGQLGLSYPWVNVAAATIFFWGLNTFAQTQKDPLAFLIFLYPVLILNMPMSGIRQGAAIGLVAIAFVHFNKGNTLRYLLWVAFATGFHTSASVFVVLAPLVGRNHLGLRAICSVLLLVPAAIALMTFDSAQLALSRYVNSGVDAQGAIFRSGMLFLTGVLYLGFLRRRWTETGAQDTRLLTFGAFGMLAVLPLVGFSTVISDRLGYFLVPLQASIFANIPFVNLGPYHNALAALPYVGLLLMLTVWTLKSTHFSYCYLPYETWLFGIPDFYKSFK